MDEILGIILGAAVFLIIILGIIVTIREELSGKNEVRRLAEKNLLIKSCSKCGIELSGSYKVGDTCPNCGAVFTYETQPKKSFTFAPLTGNKLIIPVIILSAIFVFGIIFVVLAFIFW